jgi:hypothetical protein
LIVFVFLDLLGMSKLPHAGTVLFSSTTEKRGFDTQVQSFACNLAINTYIYIYCALPKLRWGSLTERTYLSPFTKDCLKGLAIRVREPIASSKNFSLAARPPPFCRFFFLFIASSCLRSALPRDPPILLSSLQQILDGQTVAALLARPLYLDIQACQKVTRVFILL